MGCHFLLHWTHVSCVGRQILYRWATREAHIGHYRVSSRGPCAKQYSCCFLILGYFLHNSSISFHFYKLSRVFYCLWSHGTCSLYWFYTCLFRWGTSVQLWVVASGIMMKWNKKKTSCFCSAPRKPWELLDLAAAMRSVYLDDVVVV